MIEDALYYASRGWPVFPLAVRGKIPLISKAAGGNGHHDATTDIDQIKEWWGKTPAANIGLACRDFFVLDVDIKSKGDESLKNLTQQHGRLPKTLTARTGSGGWHFYFKPTGIGNTTSKLAAGLDTRGEGQGYVAAPPSIHPSGGSYKWLSDDPLAEAPEWVVAGLQDTAPAFAVKAAAPPERWRDLWVNGAVSSGTHARSNALAALTGYLLRRNLDPLMVFDMMLVWNRLRVSPPLLDTDVEQTVNSVAARELAKIKRGVIK